MIFRRNINTIRRQWVGPSCCLCAVLLLSTLEPDVRITMTNGETQQQTDNKTQTANQKRQRENQKTLSKEKGYIGITCCLVFFLHVQNPCWRRYLAFFWFVAFCVSSICRFDLIFMATSASSPMRELNALQGKDTTTHKKHKHRKHLVCFDDRV